MDAIPQKENFAAGLAGALLGALLWVGYFLLLCFAGMRSPCSLFAAMPLCLFVAGGYDLFAGSISKKGLLAVLACWTFTVFFAWNHLLFWVSVSREFALPLWEVVLAAGRLEQQGLASRSACQSGLVLAAFFGLISLIGLVLAKGSSGAGQKPALPAEPEGGAGDWLALGHQLAAANTSGGQTVKTPAGTLTLYAPEPRWIRPVWLGEYLLFALFTGVGIWLMSWAEGRGSTFWMGAGGMAVLIALITFMDDHCKSRYESLLLVRRDEQLWAVSLKELNTIRGCRFTQSTLNLPVIRWQRLTPRERAGAVQAMLRAMAALESAPPEPPRKRSRPSRPLTWSDAVLPLPDLKVERQTRAQWGVSYAAQNGSRAGMWVYKAYPGFSPAQDCEPPQSPLLFPWQRLLIMTMEWLLLGALMGGLMQLVDRIVG